MGSCSSRGGIVLPTSQAYSGQEPPAQSTRKEWGRRSIPLRVQYLHYLVDIFWCRFLHSPSFIKLFHHLYQKGRLDICFSLWVLSQVFILIDLFCSHCSSFGLGGVLAVGSRVSLAYPSLCVLPGAAGYSRLICVFVCFLPQCQT